MPINLPYIGHQCQLKIHGAHQRGGVRCLVIWSCPRGSCCPHNLATLAGLPISHSVHVSSTLSAQFSSLFISAYEDRPRITCVPFLERPEQTFYAQRTSSQQQQRPPHSTPTPSSTRICQPSTRPLLTSVAITLERGAARGAPVRKIATQASGSFDRRRLSSTFTRHGAFSCYRRTTRLAASLGRMWTLVVVSTLTAALFPLSPCDATRPAASVFETRATLRPSPPPDLLPLSLVLLLTCESHRSSTRANPPCCCYGCFGLRPDRLCLCLGSFNPRRHPGPSSTVSVRRYLPHPSAACDLMWFSTHTAACARPLHKLILLLLLRPGSILRSAPMPLSLVFPFPFPSSPRLFRLSPHFSQSPVYFHPFIATFTIPSIAFARVCYIHD